MSVLLFSTVEKQPVCPRVEALVTKDLMVNNS